jgi:hypothetical protein
MKEPKHISEIIPEAVDAMVGGRNVHERWQNSMAILELDSERKGMEEFRKYVDSKRDSNLVPTPKLGTVFYCGTGGVVDHEAIRIFMETEDKWYCRKEVNKGIRCDKQCRACIEIDSKLK